MSNMRSSQKYSPLSGTAASQLLFSYFGPAAMVLLFGLFFIQSGVRTYMDVENIRVTMPMLTAEDYRALFFRSIGGYRDLVTGVVSLCIGFPLLLVWVVKKTRLDCQQQSGEQEL